MESDPGTSSNKTLRLLRGDVGSTQRWLRGAMTRENFTSMLKTLAWVVPLTVLIWIWAEREQVTREPGVPIPIDVTSGDPARVVVRLLRPADKMIMADLDGPRSRVESVRASVARSGRPSALEIQVDPKLTPGQSHDLSTVAVIANNPTLVRNGVTVANAQPPILTVFVDVYEELELPVRPPASLTNLVAQPIFEPAKVKLRAPRQAIREAGTLIAEADLAGFDELRTPGVHELPAVRVFVPGLDSEHFTITPSTVKATLEVRQSDISYTIPSVAIYAFGPSYLLKQYRVDSPDNLTNVTVIGPPAQIELLKQANFEPKLKAALEVSRDDGVGTIRTRTLRFYDLPEGVRVSAEDARRTVDFKLLERGSDP